MSLHSTIHSLSPAPGVPCFPDTHHAPRTTHHFALRGRWPSAGKFRLRTSDFGLSFPRHPSRAFTLIELMVVMGIMAIVLTISVPAIYSVWHKEALRKAVADVVEACSHARAQAILQGTMAELVFHPQEGRFEVAGAAPRLPATAQQGPVEMSLPAPSGSGLAGQLPDSIRIDMLDVNLTEFKDSELARIRFYPNGTCDEMTLILHSDRNEQRGVTLEITTGLASVLTETDLQKLRSGTL